MESHVKYDFVFRCPNEKRDFPKFHKSFGFSFFSPIVGSSKIKNSNIPSVMVCPCGCLALSVCLCGALQLSANLFSVSTSLTINKTVRKRTQGAHRLGSASIVDIPLRILYKIIGNSEFFSTGLVSRPTWNFAL